jgi:hypothetical protein
MRNNFLLFFSIIDHQIYEFLSKFIRHIYEPYKKYVKIYTKLETSRLQNELDSIKMVNIT